METFGTYRLLKLLGAGYTGEVFEAVHQRGGPHVALKRLNSRLVEDNNASSRFRREFRAASSVKHPNVVRVMDSGRQRGVPFFTMELLTSEHLRNAMNRPENAPLARRLGLLAQLADGLQALHNAGIIHRDIKPENILMRRPDQAVITDLGLARVGEEKGFTRAGQIVGSFRYVSPEVVRGGRADPRSDAYALGVMAFELLAGKPPFTGNEAELLVAHVEQPAPDLGAVKRDIPRSVVDLVSSLMEKDPLKRPTLARTASLMRRVAVEGSAVGPPPVRPVSRGGGPELVGREGEVVRAAEWALGSGTGPVRAALVSGARGLGKSRLLQEIQKHCIREGAIVVAGSGAGFIQAAYLAWRMPLETLARKLKMDPPDFDGMAGGGADHPRRLWQQAREILDAATQLNRLVVLLDDLDRADEMSLKLLKRVVGKELAGKRVAIVAAAADTARIKAALGETPTLEVSLGALSRKDAAALARAAVPEISEELADQAAEDTGGVPERVVAAALAAAERVRAARPGARVPLDALGGPTADEQSVPEVPQLPPSDIPTDEAEAPRPPTDPNTEETPVPSWAPVTTPERPTVTPRQPKRLPPPVPEPTGEDFPADRVTTPEAQTPFQQDPFPDEPVTPLLPVRSRARPTAPPPASPVVRAPSMPAPPPGPKPTPPPMPAVSVPARPPPVPVAPPELPPMTTVPPPLPRSAVAAPPPLPARPPAPPPRPPPLPKRVTLPFHDREWPATELARWTLAVLGTRAPVSLLARILDIREDSRDLKVLQEALQELLAGHRLVEEDEGLLDFLTEPGRVEAAAAVPEELREHLHLSAAHAIQSSAPWSPATAEVLAFHFIRAGLPHFAVEHLVSAAESALAVWATDRARELVMRGVEALAVRGPPDVADPLDRAARVHPEMGLRLAALNLQVLQATGNEAAYRSAAVHALSLLAGDTPGSLAADVHVHCALALRASGDLDGAREHAVRAENAAQSSEDLGRLADVAMLHVQLDTSQDGRVPHGRLARALGAARRTFDDARLAPALVAAAATRLDEGRTKVALRLAHQALSRAERRSRPEVHLASRRLVGAAHLDLDDRKRAGRFLLDHVADAELEELPNEMVMGLVELARFHLSNGDWPHAEASAVRAATVAEGLASRHLVLHAGTSGLLVSAVVAVRSGTLKGFLERDTPKRLQVKGLADVRPEDGWVVGPLGFLETLAAPGSDAVVRAERLFREMEREPVRRRWLEHRWMRLILAEAFRVRGRPVDARRVVNDLIRAHDGRSHPEFMRIARMLHDNCE